MKLGSKDFNAIRTGIAAIPADVSNDAVGANVAKREDIYAPETHAAALDPSTSIVVGARGSGKSFWSSVLGQADTRSAAAKAYPKLGLDAVTTYFGYTGIGGSEGVTAEIIDELVPEHADIKLGIAFWWATVLRAANAYSRGGQKARLKDLLASAQDREKREELLEAVESQLRGKSEVLLVVYDALDTVARTWPRRRMLTEALLEVVWAMRAYRCIRPKLFLRPDQIDDDMLRFVELPKLRTGAVRLTWLGADLYGLLFARLALNPRQDAREAFGRALDSARIQRGTEELILARRWQLVYSETDQAKVIEILAGPYMAAGTYGYKKGKTYDWPLTHLADSFREVTPRSFLGLMIGAAKHGASPSDRAITPDGIRHGLRGASRTRVDQLHQEFPWIKGVLAPLAGLLLPKDEAAVFAAWKKTHTVQSLIADASKNKYLAPFPDVKSGGEKDLLDALERIGVMFRRPDGRIDMPDLFRVAAKLLKKGAPAPT